MRDPWALLIIGMVTAILSGVIAQVVADKHHSASQPEMHHVSSPMAVNDPTRARMVSYGSDGTVVYWADVPPGTAEIEIVVKGAGSIGSVHVHQAMTLGGLYCTAQDDGTCK